MHYQAHIKNSSEMYLSDSSTIALCAALCNEIQVYKDIIRRSMNLKSDDVRQTMEELRLSCPKETVEDSCSEKMPDMRERIEDRKGELN